MTHDVIILGGGPAALFSAAACAREGLSVLVLGGTDHHWTNTYGGWVDELASVGLTGWIRAQWPDAEVVTAGQPKRLGRAYATLHGEAIREHLLSDAGFEVKWVQAVGPCTDDGTTFTVTDADGHAHMGRAVLDGTGAVRVAVGGEAPTAFQSAYGVIVHTDWAHDASIMGFMDWTPAPSVDAQTSSAPTFLYTLPLGDGRIFFEETSLRRQQPLPYAVLKARLHARLDAMGVSVEAWGAEEHCCFPMNIERPGRDKPVVGLGLAGGFVHPATGYQFVRSVAAAPLVARALRSGLDDGLDGLALAQRAWDSVWPRELRARHDLMELGAQQLETFEHQALERFFEAFFTMPSEHWRAYTAVQGSLGAAMTAMASVFARVNMRTRWKLMKSGRNLPPVLLEAAGLAGTP